MEKIIDIVRQSAALLGDALVPSQLVTSQLVPSQLVPSQLVTSSHRVGPAVAGSAVANGATASVSHLDDESLVLLMRAVEESGRLIDALRALTAGETEERSRRELGNDGLARRNGYARATHLIEDVTRVSGAEAARRIRLGAAVRPRLGLGGAPQPPRYAEVSRALSNGSLGVDAAHSIIRCLDQAERRAQPDDLATAERSLVETAATESADLLAVHALAYREALDPDGSEPRDEELRAARGFLLGRERNGMTRATIDLDPQSAALMRAILSDGTDPRVIPRHLDPSNGSSAELADPRTRVQRQFDVIMGTLTAGMRSRGMNAQDASGSVRPTATVMAVITLADLESGRGAGWLDDVREPVSAMALQTMACDAGIRPIVLGTHGEVLHLGHPRRLFSTAQRRALAVRDGGCVWPGCSAPPSWCEAHHVIEWEQGGRTDIDNGTLLCSAHHHMLHASAFRLEMVRGRPQLLAPPWLDPQQCWRPLGRNRALMTAIRR